MSTIIFKKLCLFGTSSRETYGDAAIGYVCLKRDENLCILKALVCPEHKVCDKLYQVTLKNLPASRAHSHRALCAQLASLSAPRARDLIVALRAPIFLDLALRARSCALRIHLSLFVII